MTLPRILRFDSPAGEPALDQPREARREQGAPWRRTWTLHESPDGVFCAGIWECEVGRWRIEFPPGEDEYFHVLSGRARLHGPDGAVTDVGPGEAAVIPGGFQGSFEVLEPVRKHFVVVTRPAVG